MYHKLMAILVFLSICIFSSCAEDPILRVEETVVFEIDSVAISGPAIIGSGRAVYVYAWINHSGGSDSLVSVTIEILDSDGQTVLIESSAEDLGEGADLIAGDTVFTGSFVAEPIVFAEGDIYVQVTAVDAKNTTQRSDPLASQAVFSSPPPQMSSVDAPDLLPSGSEPLSIVAAAVDAIDGAGDIVLMEMRLLRSGIILQSFAMERVSESGDTAFFSLEIDSTFAAERSGDYTLEFQAEDEGTSQSDILSTTITLENTAPYLFAPSMRDTLPRPVTSDTIHVFISADDMQGAGDIASVSFTVTRDGGTPSAPIDMFDDGDVEANGDVLAGDSRFSRIVLFEAQNEPGTFVFDFIALDRVGQSSATLQDTLVVTP